VLVLVLVLVLVGCCGDVMLLNVYICVLLSISKKAHFYDTFTHKKRTKSQKKEK